MFAMGLILFSCAEHRESTAQSTSSPALSAITWTLGWQLNGASLDGDAPLTMVTDLGYEVTIDKGFVVTSLVSLVPCEADTGLAQAMNWFVSTAHASHPPFNDPSLVDLHAKESFTPPRNAELPTVEFDRRVYCSVYWLIARGATGGDLENTSFRATGNWQRDGKTGPLSVDTNFARAYIADLPPMRPDAHAAHGVVNRSIGTMFNGIDLETANEYAVGWGVVKNLTDQAEFEWK